MYQEQFKNLGLTAVQAEIYEFLLNIGENKASKIGQKIKRPRGVVYKGLEELINIGLVERKNTKNQISSYVAEHPTKLDLLFEQKEKKFAKDKKNYLAILPELTSAYNLSNHKPGVKFYEGEDGLKQVLYDSLNSQTEIYTFADLAELNKNLKKINEEYAKKRESLGIKKKLIVADTVENRKFFEHYNQELTQIKFLAKEYYPFSSGMQIYDNKISYQVFSAEEKIGVIVENKNIYNLHKLFFEYIWQSLEEIKNPPLT
ncbi:MAG: helix-turn-helix domain-containing protein [bacterium]|nr:helix-turn-helix domain-containing protein [bacterium]